MPKKGQTTPPLLSYADELAESLRAMLPLAVKECDETAVHQARVASRRLSAAIEVFQPITRSGHRREFARTLKKIRRRLGPIRDQAVMLVHLSELENPRHRVGLEWVRRGLLDRQQTGKESAAEKIKVAKMLARLGGWWGVREQWLEAEGELGVLLVQSLHWQLDQFISHADGVTGGCTKDNGAEVSPDLLDPHQLRIAGKALRYTLEFAAAGGHRMPAAVTRAFKRMQDALGLWHDYVVLNDYLLESIIGQRDPEIVASVLDLARTVVRKSKIQLEAFSRIWKQRGEGLARAIASAFPPTESTTVDPSPDSVGYLFNETQTDQHPPGSEALPAYPPQPAEGETSAA
jgi:CHAD domain-containing protein